MEERTHRDGPELPGVELETASNGSEVVIYDPENFHAWIVGRAVDVASGDWR